MAKDYYNILGVSKNVTAEELKKAYRRLAHQYHPDKVGGDEKKFKEINEAYQILSNTEKRRQYDQFGTTFEQGQAGGPGGAWEDVFRSGGFRTGGVEFDLGDIGEIFSDFLGGSGSRRRSRARKGADIESAVQIDFNEAVFGTTKTVELYKTVPCDRCHGAKAEPGTLVKECSTCKGIGTVTQVQQTILGSIRTQQTCATCEGEGKRFETACKKCHGYAIVKEMTHFKVKIPSGIDDGQVIRITGAGQAGAKGGPAGDLYLHVSVSKSHEFTRDGYDILSKVSMSIPQAVLGTIKTIKTVDGETQLKIPAGTAAGTKIRLRGKGVLHPHGGGRGDHIVTVDIEIPKRLYKEERKLFEELAQLRGDDVNHKKGFWA